jgi:hypothetical protein
VWTLQRHNTENSKQIFPEKELHAYIHNSYIQVSVSDLYTYRVGCALTFASEAKFEIEAKISFRFEAKKKPDFT